MDSNDEGSQIALEIRVLEEHLKKAEDDLALAESRARMYAANVTTLREEIRRLRTSLGGRGTETQYVAPRWISPGEFRGETAAKAAIAYLKKHGEYESKFRVPIESVMLPRLLAGGAHVRGETDKPINGQALRAAIARLATEGVVRYNREEDWVELSDWTA